MPVQPFRMASGGLIDRDKPLHFTFDGLLCGGYAGDTVASALIANGIKLTGRSPKYRRPRGISSIGPEQPLSLGNFSRMGRYDAHTKITAAELYHGLAAGQDYPDSQTLSRLGVPGAWFSSLLTGRMGTLKPEPCNREHSRDSCDVAVIGGGAAGMSAALSAAKTGAHVLLIDDDAQPGGWLLHERRLIDDKPAQQWVMAFASQLSLVPNLRILNRTAALTLFKNGEIGAVERIAGSARNASGFTGRRFWKISARQIVLASGAAELMLTFEGNDRPGVMTAGALRGYMNRYAAAPGRNILVATNNDGGYLTAFDAQDSGLSIEAIIDERPSGHSPLMEEARDRGLTVAANAILRRTFYNGALQGAEIESLGNGQRASCACDAIAVSGGLWPVLHLSCLSGSRPVFDQARGIFLPPAASGLFFAGSCAGHFALKDCLSGGAQAGVSAALAAGFKVNGAHTAAKADRLLNLESGAERPGKIGGNAARAFVDFENDVTACDVLLAGKRDKVKHAPVRSKSGLRTAQAIMPGLA